MRTVPRAALLIALTLACLSLPSRAWPPDESRGKVDYSKSQSWPSDPGYGGAWELWSFAPPALPKLDARTRRLGLGAHFDRAWARTAGDPRVVIAVLDSGVSWDSRDLVNKWFLNRGELPPPDDGCQDPGHRGDGQRVHDANRDGVFNVQDYTTARGHEQPEFRLVCDARVKHKGDVNHNQLLDPEDLIAAFSDGHDDDGNGYVDDIAGWDFFRNDNDARDDTGFGHGTGEARDSGAETDNGLDGAGGCPRCLLLPLRVGDSFVADASAFGVAATYAVDSGASVIQEALGTISNTPIARYGIDYAYDNHVSVVASAADENSFHHNFPGTGNHTLYLHAIRYDADNLADATHAFSFNNCSNYGAQLLLSMPGTACSSEATGKGAGLVGLLYSAALQADLPPPAPLRTRGLSDPPAGEPLRPAERARRLTAEEVRQLLIGTSDSFYDPADDHDPASFPSGPGFVRRFGYGRPNARSAVDRILLGALPPQVDIESPEWFQVLDPAQGEVAIQGRIALRRLGPGGAADRFDFTLEWAAGVDPRDDRFAPIAHGELLGEDVDGTLAVFPVRDLKIDNPVLPRDDRDFQPDDPAHVHTVTLRLRATVRSLDPLRNGLVGEARRAVHVYNDPDLLPGFPLRLGASGEASPKTADLLGDGRREIVVADGAGLLHAFTAAARELPGFPVPLAPLPALAEGPSGHRQAPAWSLPATPGGRLRPAGLSSVMASPAIGDIDGDGRPEVVVATYYGAVLAVDAAGHLRPGFPVRVQGIAAALAQDPRHALDDGFFAAPALADLDRDGRLDIVAAAMDGQVYAWRGDGTPVPGWPVRVADDRITDPGQQQQARLMGAPAIGDLDRDGVPDVVLPSNEEYDGKGRVYAISGRGMKAGRPFLPGWPIAVTTHSVLPVVGAGIPNAVALGDVDGDGVPEVFVAAITGPVQVFTAAGTPFGRNMEMARVAYGDKSDGTELATLAVISNPALGDLDGDGRLDVAMPTAGANVALSMAKQWRRLDYEMHLSVWDVQSAQQKPGFPRVVEDWLFFVNPALADVDGDGAEEVVTGSAGYFVHAWNADGKEARGFPRFTGGWIAATPAFGDLDGDGRLEMAVNTRDGWLFAWHLGARTTDRIDWESFHHDNRNTGNFSVKLDRGGPGGPAGCQAAAGAATGAAGAVPLLVLWGSYLYGLYGLYRRRRYPARRSMLLSFESSM